MPAATSEWLAVVLGGSLLSHAPAKRRRLNLSLMKDRLAVCRSTPGEKAPDWVVSGGGFASATRTGDGLSVVCAETAVPQGIKGWLVRGICG
jgi:hypothetical protein